MPRVLNLSSKYMSLSDKQQLRAYSKEVERISSSEHLLEKAHQYVREDKQITNLNYHLTSFYPELN